ncbi:MAG: cytochrome c3 family protein [Aquabacterium sp.]
MTAAFWGFAIWRGADQVSDPIAQPVPFSHKHHVGDDGLDCRYCHTTVDEQPFAGMPSAHVCLTCHSQLFKNEAVLAPLRQSEASGQPIEWVRLHKLPDFVYFDHSVHVHKGVACIECHGRIDQMPLTWRTAPLTMRWCLACHRDPTPHLHPASSIFAMPPSQALDGADQAMLAHLYKLESARRLTDCTTCHR